MIGIMGNKFFAERIISALEDNKKAVFLSPSLHDLNFGKKTKNVKLIHYIGSPTVTLHGVLTLLRLKILGKKIVVHWIGADSWLATNKTIPKIFSKTLKKLISKHIAIEKNLSKRIETIGINNQICPLPVATHFKLQPMPKIKQFLVYLPDHNEYYWERFNGELIKKIVQEFPLINFIILRNSGKYFDNTNVKCIEWTDDMENIYKSVLGMIRITKHDGQPGTIIEALSMGRHYIFSQDFPYCKKAENFNELKDAIKEILENPTLNEEGAKYVNKEYSVKKIANDIQKIYNEII